MNDHDKAVREHDKLVCPFEELMEHRSKRYMCIKCGDDYLSHHTIIEDRRGRCICLNCWNKFKRVNVK